MKKIVIVGGVAGGATAATRARRLSEEDQIIIFEKDEYISFANCGLPYYIGNVISNRERLLVETPETFRNNQNIDVRIFSEVIAIDTKKKKVTVQEVKTGRTYEETFDKLLLAPGATPIWLPIPGIEQAHNVFSLRNLNDTDKIDNFINHEKVESAVVIGGSFIGIELAENLLSRGIKVTIIDLASQILPPLDFEMAKIAQNEFETNGVKIYLQDTIAEIKDNGQIVVLKSGMILKTDLIIMAAGIRPESKLALSGGIKTGEKGHILTNDHLQVMDAKSGEVIPDVYAVGDAIEVKDYIDGTPIAVPLAWPASRQARLVADHMNGWDVKYNGSLGTSIVKVFSLTVASTGNNEKTLQRKKVDYRSTMVTRSNHAGYYPGANDIVIKLLFSPEKGKILGAQVIGKEGVDKRIDVIATAIKGGLTIFDLPDIQLAYAPPYGSSKDPVNIAGYVASNMMQKEFGVVNQNELETFMKNKGILIDARTPLEFSLGHIEGAINIPFSGIRQNLDKLPQEKDAPLLVYCNVGQTAYLLIKVLVNHGYTNVSNLLGGYKIYKILHQNTRPEELRNPEHRLIEPASNTHDNNHDEEIKVVIDACGLQCPGPIMQTYKAVEKLKEGEIVKVIATDSGYFNDVEKWCLTTGNTLLKKEATKEGYVAIIQKGSAQATPKTVENQNTTIVLFSGDMDKAMASMIIAQGSRSMGKNVTIFCTFWGLNLLRKEQKVKVKKSLIEKMFGAMMPRGPKKMPISKMNFGGMGAKMMKSVMKKKNVDSLPDLIAQAKAAGVKFIACTMSMDVMGIRKEELIDGIEYAGVATYLADSEKAGITLFI
ncbi:MAG: CoA-disulfide reductase [Bacilli bacterium]|jgi:NADPH-dependent 2,4-dienoyl-CoA reductase/sulfur reductase-like enzyme/peroxiredoxin family protein/TusA-related sulfurtransferase/rhodanese-related sulfurtransferase|nr:CoA-disulfide reductase [Bacilli bacterium]